MARRVAGEGSISSASWRASRAAERRPNSGLFGVGRIRADTQVIGSLDSVRPPPTLAVRLACQRHENQAIAHNVGPQRRRARKHRRGTDPHQTPVASTAATPVGLRPAQVSPRRQSTSAQGGLQCLWCVSTAAVSEVSYPISCMPALD